VKGSAFNGCEKLVLRRIRKIPTESNTAQFGIDEHGAIAIIPSQPKQAGLARAIQPSS